MMKLKQRFPFLALTALSVVMLVIFPLVNFFAPQFQREVFQQLDRSFQMRAILLALADGLGKAALILVCIWLGVGINNLILRIQDSAKRRLAMNGVVFGSLLLCVALPILGLIFTYTVLSPQESWQQIPTPPETAQSIAAGFFNRVIIETENGNYFSHNIPDNGQGWQEEENPDTAPPPEMDDSVFPNVEAPGTLISILGVPSYPGSTQKVYFAILEDHTVWYLPQAGSALLATALLATLFVPILVGSLLILAGMGAIPLLNWLAARIWRAP